MSTLDEKLRARCRYNVGCPVCRDEGLTGGGDPCCACEDAVCHARACWAAAVPQTAWCAEHAPKVAPERAP